jgi:hypothetical protein
MGLTNWGISGRSKGCSQIHTTTACSLRYCPIINGARLADLQYRGRSYEINLKTAKALGFEIAAKVLALADEVTAVPSTAEEAARCWYGRRGGDAAQIFGGWSPRRQP